ncbi:hypothetical protein BDV97DRAFT_378281 [Delphinella strobiligena]|nr:hypothetical protein BDV97DRAFT_378281 [Delphinella strobiligena]
MYFQHYTGEIRWMRLTDRGWVGGDDTTVVVSNAKNGTPISAVSYVLDNVSTWHIFYINDSNFVNQKSNSNMSNLWVDGPLNDLDLVALDADQPATPGPPSTTITYLMLVDAQNTLEFWWKDTNTSLATTPTHPINTWVNTSIAIAGMHPSTSLGYTNFLYAQLNASNRICGFNVSWAAEDTSFAAPGFAVAGDSVLPGLGGTHLSVSTLPTASGGDEVVVFYQVGGADITEFLRDLDGGVWSATSLSLPD